MTSKADQKVVVTYPHHGPVEHGFMRSMLELWRYDALGGRTSDGAKVGGRRRILEGGGCIDRSTAILLRARTDLVHDFLKLDADWAWLVDDDMTFAPDIVDRLVEAAHPTERPIVGGLCFAYMREASRRFWPTLYAWIPGTDGMRRLMQYPDDRLVQVAGTGAACLLVHRTVFEKMAERFPGPRPWFAETETSDGDLLSEDLTFCIRAQACGFPIYVHTGIKLGHLKSFVADEEAFIAESGMIREACVPALPTYVVIASKDRPEMLETLRTQLEGQVTDSFVFDNGYGDEDAPALAILAEDWSLHRMWNAGLDMAEKSAAGKPYNVLIVNDDVEVPNEFCAQLEAGLRSHDDHWISYPNWRELDLEPGRIVRTSSDGLAGQTMSGWAFMVRGEAGLRFDERFQWWYGDSDLERQVKEAGKFTVCVGGCFARHLDPLRSTLEDPERLAQAEADEAAFAEKWGVDPETLWLAQRKAAVG